MKVILASTSPRRIEILSKTDLKFEAHPALFEEDMSLDLDPVSLAKYLSFGKANSLVARFSDALIIGADTFIVHEGKLLGKPHTPEKSVEMLASLSGKTHSVLTGLVIIETPNGQSYSHVEETKIKFRNLSNEEILKYVATNEPLDKAGAYAIQGGAAEFVEKIDGDYFNVMGLPLDKLIILLDRHFGVQVKRVGQAT